MIRTIFPLALAVAGILAGHSVLTAAKALQQAAPAPAEAVPTLTRANQAAWGRAQGLPGF